MYLMPQTVSRGQFLPVHGHHNRPWCCTRTCAKKSKAQRRVEPSRQGNRGSRRKSVSALYCHQRKLCHACNESQLGLLPAYTVYHYGRTRREKSGRDRCAWGTSTCLSMLEVLPRTSVLDNSRGRRCTLAWCLFRTRICNRNASRNRLFNCSGRSSLVC